jgi:sec-independent protein translocase protein TatA
MGFGSPLHWMILLVIVLLLFGNRLPSVMRSLGRGVTEFKKGLEGTAGEDEEEELPKPKKKPVGEIEEKSNGADKSAKDAAEEREHRTHHE